MKMFEKSTPPSASPMGGIKRSLVNAVTIFWNAAPTVNPTGRSITLPLIANCLNSETIDTMRPPLLVGVGDEPPRPTPIQIRQSLKSSSYARGQKLVMVRVCFTKASARDHEKVTKNLPFESVD